MQPVYTVCTFFNVMLIQKVSAVPYFAGIDYPERSGANDAIGNIVCSLTRSDAHVR